MRAHVCTSLYDSYDPTHTPQTSTLRIRAAVSHSVRLSCFGYLGSILAHSQRSATMNTPGVAGYVFAL